MTTPNTHQAMVWAVLELHKPTTIRALTGDCATDECMHGDPAGCETSLMPICAACHGLAESVYPYYSEEQLHLAEYPCATVRAIKEAEGSE